MLDAWDIASSQTVDDICAEAEVSKGAFYGYFSSKQELLIALLEEDAADLRWTTRCPRPAPSVKC